MNEKLLKCALLFLCNLIFFSSCGLDEYYALSYSGTSYNTNSITSANYTSHTSVDTSYFEFESASDPDLGGAFKFDGTAVYYKIYNNYSTMNTHISNISSKSSSTNESAAATTMIDTYGYKELGTSNGSRTPLISGGKTRLRIRLTNNSGSDEYSAGIFELNDGAIAGNYGIPMRAGNDYNFDFGRKYESGSNAGNYVRPAEGDDDVYYSSTTSCEGIWYVNMYAVAVGHDSSFTTYYSNVLHLGSVAIDANDEDN